MIIMSLEVEGGEVFLKANNEEMIVPSQVYKCAARRTICFFHGRHIFKTDVNVLPTKSCSVLFL